MVNAIKFRSVACTSKMSVSFDTQSYFSDIACGYEDVVEYVAFVSAIYRLMLANAVI